MLMVLETPGDVKGDGRGQLQTPGRWDTASLQIVLAYIEKYSIIFIKFSSIFSKEGVYGGTGKEMDLQHGGGGI